MPCLTAVGVSVVQTPPLVLLAPVALYMEFVILASQDMPQVETLIHFEAKLVGLLDVFALLRQVVSREQLCHWHLC